ncbi:helix-turn-helix transcriptional regulator [Intestinirhabdus alba]|jgi:DNA-binding CsgD family transcriptional regulator|uniref:LuxR family transcriptional regulator n=1 Tax=Intestinirhabdus alba TaxID=2899544 RepID=A0A6L6IKQ3_9ENTR|nr:LuxR family transcriptional regulator [Intestinirhabdus alba]MTH46715.1 LuxR family transcriptional regulator [Intestinirhabdus alba]
MLNVLLIDSNHYWSLGLSLLIVNQLADNSEPISFLLPENKDSRDIANIIFRDDLVTIHVDNKKSVCKYAETAQKEAQRITIHVPFLTKSQSLSDITIKIAKILAIAKADYNLLANKEESYWNFGLKKYAQLSDTENDVMILIGHGYNSTDISRILNRSRKTISTHYRNASRKMGAANRAEFYRYASFIAQCRRDERNTLCL